MQSQEEIDPEIAARHKAVYDDLLNEIEGLESEDEDEQPQKPVAKPTAKNTSPPKKNKAVVDDDGDDFPKFDDTKYKAMQNEAVQGLKVKNEYDDLEKQIGNLDSDGEEEVEEASKSPKKPVHKEVKQAPVTKPVTESVPKKVQESVQKPKEVPFPMCHFVGVNTANLIALDNKLHGKECMMTIALVDYEIKNVIEPCLSSDAVSAEVKAHLEDKKNNLLKNKSKITGMFKAGQLNAAKYTQIIGKMKTDNIKIAQELQKNNAVKEANRVKERLRILLQEEKENTEGTASSVAQSTASTASPSQKKIAKQGSSSQVLASSGIGAEIPSELDNLSSKELLKVLKKRKDQYYNLATYINREVLKVLDGNEAAQKKTYLQTAIIPLIQKAIHFIEALERDEEVAEARAFLKEELEEVKPRLLHGKSLEERGEELKKLIDSLEVCLEEENDYVEKMRQTLNDPNQPMGPIGKKIKEGEKLLEKYAEYIEYLSKLDSDKFMWEPTPKINISKEQRMISLMNKDIPGNSLLLKFTKLDHIKHRPYYIKWSIDTANGFETHNSSLCDGSSLKFNYQQMIQLCSKDKLDPSIESKEIKVEVLFTQLFLTKKKGEANIPLAPLKKTNHYEGKIKVRDDGIELSYVLQVREPLLKHIKVDVTTVHSFQKFPSFNRDAPVVQVYTKITHFSLHYQPNQSTQKKQPNAPSPSHSQVQKNPAQEESKSKEPAPAAPSGGANAGGGGGKLFEKKKYPPLVLLPQTPDPLAGITQDDIPAGVTLDQAMDPSNPDKIECLAVLKELGTELEKARVGLASEGRRNENKVVGDNWTKSLKNAAMMEARFGNGDIEPTQYVDQLKACIERDNKLIEFYKAKGDNSRMAFIEAKMKLVTGELTELEAALAGGEE